MTRMKVVTRFFVWSVADLRDSEALAKKRDYGVSEGVIIFKGIRTWELWFHSIEISGLIKTWKSNRHADRQSLNKHTNNNVPLFIRGYDT